MKNVLIALDYNPSARLIAETGYQMARQIGAQVTLVHVVSDATYYSSLNYSPIMGFDSFSNMDVVQNAAVEDLKGAANEYLLRSREHLGDPNIITVVREGDFARNIIDLATEINADLIVMGTHSRRGLDKIFMGSVAQSVIGKSAVPVLVIPTGEFDEE